MRLARRMRRRRGEVEWLEEAKNGGNYAWAKEEWGNEKKYANTIASAV